MTDVISDALIDSIKTFPFILLIYILMELIESARSKEKIERALSGSAAPVAAGLLGAVPECGFSVMCAKLFDEGLIKPGTLIAALLSVSDEGLIVLLSSGMPARDAVLFLAVKILYAVLAGMAINFLFAKKVPEHVCPEKNCCIECGSRHENPWDRFFLHPLSHAVKTFLYVLLLSFVLGLAIWGIGEESFTAFMEKSAGVQPLIAALIGLIPNCAASILIAQTYMSGVLTFPALLAGLCSSAGLGLIILYKNGKKIKRNLAVTAGLFVSALILGYFTLLLGI